MIFQRRAEPYEKRKRINKDNTDIYEGLVKPITAPNDISKIFYEKNCYSQSNYCGMVNAIGNTNIPYNKSFCHSPTNISCRSSLNENFPNYNQFNYSGMENANGNANINFINFNYPSPTNIDCGRLFTDNSSNYNSSLQNEVETAFNSHNENSYPSPAYSNLNSSLSGSISSNYRGYQNQDNLIRNDCSNSINNDVINLNSIKELNQSLKYCNIDNSICGNNDKNRTSENFNGYAECNIILSVPDYERLEEPIEEDMEMDDMEKKITYDYETKKKSSNGEKEKKMKLKICFNNIFSVLSDLDLLVVEQTNTKTEEVEKVHYHINKDQENIEIILKTNQGEDKYKTNLYFMEGVKKKLIIKNLKTLTTRAFRDESKKKLLDMISSLKITEDFIDKCKKENGRNKFKKMKKFILIDELKKKEGMCNLKTIFFKIVDSYELEKLKELENSLIKIFKELVKKKEFNESMCEKFNKERLSKKEKKVIKIKSICDLIFRSNELGLYISFFEYIYKCIIEKFNNAYHDHDISITKYFYHDCVLKNFIQNYNIGFCKYNDVIIFSNYSERQDPEENKVEHRRKRQRRNCANEIVHDKPISNSDSEKFIS